MTIEEYLEKTLEHLGVEGEIEIATEESEDRLRISITVPQEEVALLIGSRGETIDAIELLTKLTFKDEYEGKRIILDINEYRVQQEERLKEKALDIAYQVLETGRSYELRYLNSYERFLVHSILAEEEDLAELESFSEDRKSGRVLVIALKEEAASNNEDSEEIEEVESPEEE
jgi:spoIIIJ-associated protein